MEQDSIPTPSPLPPLRSKRGRPLKPKQYDDFDVSTRPKAKRSRLGQGASSSAKEASDITLTEVINGNGKLIPHVVKLWVERYETEPKPAMDELFTMLFQACGAKDFNKGDLVSETDVDDVVDALVNYAISGDFEDYQILKKEFKIFKENLDSFWHNLVCECLHGPLFDQVLFDKCMDYIIALSCTPPRAYRQVASLMGLQLVTSYITIANMLCGQRMTTRRHLDAEKKKRNESPLLESLSKRFSDAHDKITLLEEMMRRIFTGLFLQRYRDIDPYIRMSCIEALGVWILSYPSLFLQDLYLKYLGWTLNDRNAGVRKTSIKALQNLYETDDNVPSLGLFSERFSRRMIELPNDIDVSVAVCAIGLVKQLLRHQLVPEDDLAPLYNLLIADPPVLRHAIGALVYDHLIAQKFNSSQSAPRGETVNSSEVHLKRMLRILEEVPQDPIFSIYVIDDVWDYMKAIKDWKCIVSMLLDDNPFIELSDSDASNLVRLLCASVKKAVGETIVPDTDNIKQYHNRAQKEAYESNKYDITVALMKSYPLLLRKFISDNEKVSSLLEIILYMDLELYSLKRQEQSFKNILQLMKEAFFKHGDKDTLRACVNAIDFCCEESQGELQDLASNKLKELEDELISKLKSAIKVVVDGGDEYSLLVNSKRLYELQLSISVPINDNLYDDIVMVLRGFRNMKDEVFGFLLLNMYLHMTWGLLSFIDVDFIYEASLVSFLYKRDALLQELEYLCHLGTDRKEGGKQRSELACRVCVMLAEIWYLFRRENFSNTKLERLLCEPNEYVLRKFWELCKQQLNVSEEEEHGDATREYFEEANRCIVMTAAVKVVAFDAVPKEYLASEIISHFVMHGTDVAEIVEQLISHLEKKDDDLAAILLQALKKAYHRHVNISASGTDSSDSTFLSGCKDLAARLSEIFTGAARIKHKAVISEIVRDGIEYAFVDAPTQLSFLEAAVLPFVPKLSASDVLEIMGDIQKRTENVNTDEDPSGWRPYHTFISVLEKYVKNDGNQEEKETGSVGRMGRPRNTQYMEGKRLFGDQSSSDDEDSNTESENDAHDEEESQEENEEESQEENEEENQEDEGESQEKNDEDVPLIRLIKSPSMLTSLGSKDQTMKRRLLSEL